MLQLGILFVTTEPAPIIDPSPMVTPLSTITLKPIHALLSIVTGAISTFVQSFFPLPHANTSFALFANTTECELWSTIVTPHEIRTSSPIDIFPAEIRDAVHEYPVAD